MKDSTSHRPQAAGAAGEKGDEELEYGEEEEEEEKEEEELEVPEKPPPKSAMRKKESGKKKAAFIISGPAKGDQRAISAEGTDDHLHHLAAQLGASKAAMPRDRGLLRCPSVPPLPTLRAQDRAALCG